MSLLSRKQYLYALSLLVLVAILAAIFMFTSPTSGGPALVLGVQLLLFLLVSIVMYGFIWVLITIFGVKLSKTRSLVVIVSFSVGVLLLIGLQTLNQLNVIDVVLVVLLEVVLNFYVFRRLGAYKS